MLGAASSISLALLYSFIALISNNVSAASQLPELKAQRWVNTAPLTPNALRG